MQNVISVFKEMQKLLILIADTDVKLTVINKRLVYYWQYISNISRYYADLLKQIDHFMSASISEDDDEIKND